MEPLCRGPPQLEFQMSLTRPSRTLLAPSPPSRVIALALLAGSTGCDKAIDAPHGSVDSTLASGQLESVSPEVSLDDDFTAAWAQARQPGPGPDIRAVDTYERLMSEAVEVEDVD